MLQYNYAIYLQERRLIFVYVPKVACTNWKSIMRYMQGSDDYVGRENLADDTQVILDAIACDIAFPTQEEIKFKPTGATDKISKYYTQKEIDLVVDIFKKDFELLGYSTDIKKSHR
jgi:hypothetical protein